MNHERLHYLNGLRGILAVIVFIHHFFFALCPGVVFGGDYQDFLTGTWTLSRWLAYTPLNCIFNPGMAISFFFLLSGYVQAHHYFKTQDTVFLQRSFIKRYFRLAIPVLAVVMLIYAFHRLHLIHKNYFPQNPLTAEWIKSMMPDNHSFLGLINYALILCFNGDTSYYQILWTMSPELYNSWMVMILLFVTHRIKNKIPLLLLWILVQVIALQAFYSISFSIGVLICNLQNNSEKFSRIVSKPFLKWLMLAVGLYFASYPFIGYENSSNKSIYRLVSFFDFYPHVLSYVIGNALLFILILYSERIKKILSAQTFLFFGNISFMFYLTHFLLLFSFSSWMYIKLFPLVISNANLWLTGLASFAVITAVSWLLTKYIDEPVVKYCNIYTKKIFGI